MKEMKKLSRSKAGVSPVIATILLILIAIAAGVIIYTYTIGFLGTAGPETGQGELVIDAATYDVSLTNATLFIRNVGGVNLEFAAGSVFATHVSSGTLDVSTALCTTDPLAPDQSTDCVGAGLSIGATAGDDVLLKIVAEDGTTVSVTVKAIA